MKSTFGIWRQTVQMLCGAALAALVLAGGSFCAHAQQGGEPAPRAQEVAFDIPSQPLAAALSDFATASGTQVLYETSLATGKMSAPVKGKLEPEAALRALLSGTGLVGRRTDVDAITIAPEPRDRIAAASAVVPDARFLGALQSGILNALCRNAQTRPGAYRMALQLWIAPDGLVRHASLLGSTGDARRDASFVPQLRDVQIAVRPPPGMNQPITLAIVPRSPLQRPECGDP
ncbi:STN domain-containing protein [Bradyrhizobium sp. LHD-71]|uniref:STN domain-containing protein n=1 Tax=Bradyrhizobium sp. LHD-71 TaxID=3072141 RepID=UPI00280E0CF2|nr:STN domain-containing protein [Bradyrhizobium sp. LHD-71]MDQ8731539.1 STN domain-containing protein [Bradyrhizobium sp. LHD-71]